tara:strand:- start:302 stop:556 length:255 start_codon:yes stop_codon:yes gene_type:complete
MQDYWEKREEAWDDYFASSDAIRERYASEIKDLEVFAKSEEEYYEYLWKVQEAGFGTDCEAYEANWKRTIEYYEERQENDRVYV